MKKLQEWIKKYRILVILIVCAVVSISVDIFLKSSCELFNEINRILFSLVTVIVGFWVTCYLLFLQIYKDRYPLIFLKNKYLPQMKQNITYIVYSIIFGCFVIVKDGGLVENFCYTTTTLYTVYVIVKSVYDASKTIMVNTYIDEFCEDISQKLQNNENGVKKGIFKNLKYVLDECVIKEEYYVVQNISEKMGTIFREFLKKSIELVGHGEKNEVEDSFERIVSFGVYQLELCKDISSELIIKEISIQQINNIEFCIEADQYEWFKKYIRKLTSLTFRAQKEGKEKVAEETFVIYTSILEKLIDDKKIEWIEYMLNKLFSLTTSLNFLSSNINLKYFASMIVYGLLNCENKDIYASIFTVFKNFTSVASRVSKGFSDIKVYYALFFNNLIRTNSEERLCQFLDTIFKYGQDRGNDVAWTEFKFYCIREVQEKVKENATIKINEYHIRLLLEVIEMKEQYTGYMFLPQFEDKLNESQYSRQECEEICEDIKYLFGKCIINDNLNMFFEMIKCTNRCIIGTKARNKDMQIAIFNIYIWLVDRCKRINNKQFLEIVIIELEDIIEELDKKRAISNDFGDAIIGALSEVAKHSDSDSQIVILYIIDLFHGFLQEHQELHFINSYPKRKEMLYKGLFNIATSCIENDFEEGVRRCSNTIGWFTIYSLKQGQHRYIKYLLQLAKEMLDISIEMKVSTKTQAFLLTLFTTVGMYCCKDAANYVHIESILKSIEKIDKNLIYTAIKIRTYENDMWDSLFENNTRNLSSIFKKKYEEHQKQIGM